PYRILCPPKERRWHPGRSGSVLHGRFQHLTDEASRYPVCHRDASPASRHPQELRRGPLGPGSKHRPEHRDGRVEYSALVRQLLRVTDLEYDGERFRGGTRLPLTDEVRRDVDATHHRAGSSGGNGEVTSATGNIEHALPRTELQAGDEFSGAAN